MSRDEARITFELAAPCPHIAWPCNNEPRGKKLITADFCNGIDRLKKLHPYSEFPMAFFEPFWYRAAVVSQVT